MWYLCSEVFHTTPDDPRITEMDPVQKMWMYNNWVADQNDRAELAKNHAYLLASFSNPEAVQQILGAGNHESSDDDYEESMNIVKNQSFSLMLDKDQPIKKRRRHHLAPQG